MKSLPLLILTAITFFLLGVPIIGAETIVVSEKFDDGDRRGQNLPTSLEWFSSTSKSGCLEAEPGKLTLMDADRSIRHAVAYFAPPGEGISPKPGEALVLTFDFTPGVSIQVGLNAFRFGLFDSRGESENRFTADGDNPNTVTSSGYLAFLHIREDMSIGVTIYKRSGTGNLLTISEAMQKIDSLPIPDARMEAGKTYMVEMRIAPAAKSEATISVTIQDKEASFPPLTLDFTDAVDAPSAFDTVAIAARVGISEVELAKIKIAVVPAK